MSEALTPLEQQFLDEIPNSPALVVGPLFIGIFLDAILLGVILSQFVYWSLRLRKDEKWPIRALVYYLALASLAHSIFAQCFGWSVFVGGYGDQLNILRGWWTKAECLMEFLIAMPVEVFYAWRAHGLWGRPRIMKYGLCLIFLASSALAIANISTGPSDPISVTTSPLFVAWAVSLLLIDWILSAVIVVALYKKRSGLAQSDRLVMRLVFMSAEAQLVPSLATLGLVIKALIGTKSLAVLALIAVPKLWVVCCLLVINHRRSLRRAVETERQRIQNTLSHIPLEINEDIEAGKAKPTSDRSWGEVPTVSYADDPDRSGSPLAADRQHVSLSFTDNTNPKNDSNTPSNPSLSFSAMLGTSLGVVGYRRGSQASGSGSFRSQGVREPDDEVGGELSFAQMLKG